MHPLLIEIGPLPGIGVIPIHTYGFMIALGFIIGVLLNRWLAIRSKIDLEKLIDMTFWGMLVGFLGARLLYVLTRPDYFLADPMAFFRVWEGGLVFFGGPLAVVPWGLWYMKKNRMPMWKTMDVVIIGFTLGHAFGRIGCLGAGCCYGKPTGTSFGVHLHTEIVEASLRGIPLHPTQIYESVALFLLAAGLLYVFFKKVFDGQVIFTYFMAYPIIRSIIEIFRGDKIRGFVIEGILSTSQFISILVFAAATFALVWRLRQVRREEVIA